MNLLINGVSQGVKTPDSSYRKCSWTNLTWASGTIRAEGRNASGQVVCSEEKKTHGAAHHLVLSLDPQLVKPNGQAFQIKANGSDCAFILAKVVDASGNLCYTYNGNINFTVSGPAVYRGSYDIYVTSGQSVSTLLE